MFSPDNDYRIKSGSFTGFEALKTSIRDETVVVIIEVLGRPVEVWYPLASIDEHLEPFTDVPRQLQVDQPDERLQQLRFDHPDAKEIYATNVYEPGSIQLSRSKATTRLVLQHSITTEATTGEMKSVSIGCQVPEGCWQQLRELIEKSNFWSLPYDDGRRYPSRQQPRSLHLEGWNGSKYHCVKRNTIDSDCQIEPICQFLHTLFLDTQQEMIEREEPSDANRSPNDETV